MCCCSTSRLSNLDAKLRQDVRVEIRELQRKLGLTTVMVTHDQEEALTMADRLVVMSEGRIRQIGSQQDLYERPAEKFVADFVGRSTFIDGRMDGPGRFVSAGGLVVACEGSGTGDASLALRPERLALMTAAAPGNGQQLSRRGGIHLLSRIAGRSARAPVAKGTRHRADPEPAGTAAAGDRRTGPYRLEQIDRPRISIIISCQPTPGGIYHDHDRNPAVKSCSVPQRWPAPPACRACASAQAKGRIVVGTWGGDYARLLNKNIEQPILIKDGWEVVQDQAGDPERRSKMLAEMRLPRGTTDVQGLSALNMFQMHDAGVSMPIDYGKLKNAGNLLPSMKYPYGVGHIYSGKVGVYNPKLHHDRAQRATRTCSIPSTATSSASSTSSISTRWSARRSPPAARSTISSPARSCCWSARRPACASIRPTRRLPRA